MIPAILSLIAAIGCYAITQLQQHKKLEWSKGHFRFWSEDSDKRKYKNLDEKQGPAFPLSTTLLVFLTDGYHFFQFWMFNFLAVSMTFALGFNWYLLLGLLIGIRFINWLARKLFSK